MKSRAKYRIRILTKEGGEIPKRIIQFGENKVFLDRRIRTRKRIEFDRNRIADATLIKSDHLGMAFKWGQGTCHQKSRLIEAILRHHHVLIISCRIFTGSHADAGDAQFFRVPKREIEGGAIQIAMPWEPTRIRAWIMTVFDGFGVVHEIALQQEFKLECLPDGRVRGKKKSKAAFPIFLRKSHVFSAQSRLLQPHLLL